MELELVLMLELKRETFFDGNWFNNDYKPFLELGWTRLLVFFFCSCRICVFFDLNCQNFETFETLKEIKGTLIGKLGSIKKTLADVKFLSNEKITMKPFMFIVIGK